MSNHTLTVEKTPQKPTQGDKGISYEALLESREKALLAKEQLEAEIAIINEGLLLKLAEEKVNGKVVGNWTITKATRYSFTEVTIDKARELGCVKESVDQSALKKLYLKGIEIPEAKKSEYILVRAIEKNNE